MKHRAKAKTFSRESGPRKALIRGLVYSLVEHGRIKTTLAKAKELRRHVDRAVTLGKDQTLHARRLLLSRYPNEAAVQKIMGDISPRFKARPGGYTRILKVGVRPGDCAEMALIQFVDYKPVEPTPESLKLVEVKKRSAKRAYVAKRKHIRNLQEEARKIARR